jgi:hypothetical protein
MGVNLLEEDIRSGASRLVSRRYSTGRKMASKSISQHIVSRCCCKLVGEADIDHGTLNIRGFELQRKIGRIAGRRTQKLEIFVARRSVMTTTSQQRLAEEQ